VALDREGIALKLVAGSDAHVVPEMVAKLRSGQIPSIAGSRYVLVEPPHHVAPPRLEDTFFALLAARYVPVLTHPERLSWIEGQFGLIQTLSRRGVRMQITAGSLSGRFGRRAAYWATRMLDEGLVDILATDAHDVRRRPPDLGKGRDCAAKRVGEEEAIRMVSTRPRSILRDEALQKTSDPFSRFAFDGVDNAKVKLRGNHRREASDPRERSDAGSRKSGHRAGNFAGRLRKLFGV
jgi:protein-tyrosine phosphatase